MPTQVQAIKPASSGSGGILGAIGAAIGIIAAPFTGGASLAATAGLASAGSAIGGTVGNLIDPAKGAQDIGVKTGDALSRRAGALPDAAVKSSDSSAILQESLQSVKAAEMPQVDALPSQGMAMARRRQKGFGVGGIS